MRTVEPATLAPMIVIMFMEMVDVAMALPYLDMAVESAIVIVSVAVMPVMFIRKSRDSGDYKSGGKQEGSLLRHGAILPM